jgi:surfeit locus 1 family protein
VAATLAGTAVFLALGFWQLERAEEKDALAGAAETGAEAPPLTTLPRESLPEELRYRRVRLTGRYVPGRQILLDQMTTGGGAGIEVLTPFVTETGRWVLVNRGWLAVEPARRSWPDVTVPDSTRTIVGRLNELPRPGLRLGAGDAGAEGWPRAMVYPTAAELEAALGRPLPDYQVQLGPDEPHGYLRAWEPRGFGAERHLGYAVQWFAFAVVLWVIFFVLNLRRKER